MIRAETLVYFDFEHGKLKTWRVENDGWQIQLYFKKEFLPKCEKWSQGG